MKRPIQQRIRRSTVAVALVLLVAVFAATVSAQETAIDPEALVDDLIDFDLQDQASEETPLSDTTDAPPRTEAVDEGSSGTAPDPGDSNGASNEDTHNDAATYSVDETIPAEIETEKETVEAQIKVNNSLESLSDEQLKQICVERGFDIVKEDGSELTHEDYVEAASQCLSLEDEISSILNENPELAAELDEEIDRIKARKETLESEREEILAEKEELEQRLRESGVDPATLVPPTPASPSSNHLKPTNDVNTHEGALRESFELLFDRVGRDMRLVGKAARFALRPLGAPSSLVWRYTEPTVAGVVKKVMVLTDIKQLKTVRKVVTQQTVLLSKVYRTAALPILSKGHDLLAIGLQRLNRMDKVRTVFVVAGAVFGPLKNSLREGWKSIQPDVLHARGRFIKWIKRLRAEATSKSGT